MCTHTQEAYTTEFSYCSAGWEVEVQMLVLLSLLIVSTWLADCFAQSFTFILGLKDLLRIETTHHTHNKNFNI